MARVIFSSAHKDATVLDFGLYPTWYSYLVHASALARRFVVECLFVMSVIVVVPPSLAPDSNWKNYNQV